MRRISAVVVLLFAVTAVVGQVGPASLGACADVAAKLKLPQAVGKRKQPNRLKWEDVDKVMTRLREELQGRECRFSFAEVFRFKQKKDEEIFFPLTNNVLRTSPEGVFEGIEVFNHQVKVVGRFANRVPHERSGGGYAKKSYTLFSFQFKNSSGEFESVGGRLLYDDYLVRWNDIKEKVALTSK